MFTSFDTSVPLPNNMLPEFEGLRLDLDYVATGSAHTSFCQSRIPVQIKIFQWLSGNCNPREWETAEKLQTLCLWAQQNDRGVSAKLSEVDYFQTIAKQFLSLAVMPVFEIASLRAPERPFRCRYWHFGAPELRIQF